MHPEPPDQAAPLFDTQSHRLHDEARVPVPSSSTELPYPVVPPRFREDRMRGKVVDRLRLAAVRHCGHTVELSGTATAVGPHAIVFFYVEPPADGTRGSELRVATRLFFDTAHTTDLTVLLRGLVELAGEYAATGLDLRRQLCNRVEPMGSHARFIGVGVSTVLPVERDARAMSRADSLGLDLPYRGIALLADGTELVLDGPGGLGPVDVQSTHTLDVNGVAIRRWRSCRPHAELPDSVLTDTFLALEDLRRLAATDGERTPPIPRQRDREAPRNRGRHHPSGGTSRPGAAQPGR